MASSKVSQSPYLRVIASALGTIGLGFGIVFTLDPSKALPFFEFEIPSTAADRKLAESLIILYATRDIFMGLTIYAGAYFGERRTLGWTLIASSAVAVADGFVCLRQIGTGEWNHWGYAPILMVVGALLLGILDGP